MAVGVVALNAIAEPENLAHPEKVAQPLFNFGARAVWIAVLIKKARFAGEERACAVHFDRAAFQNHPRIKNRGFQDLGHARRHDFIEIERRIFISPCVVIPIDDREFWIDIARQKSRAVIAAPGLVRRDFVIGDALLMRELIEDRARFSFMRAVANINANGFRVDKGPDHFAQCRQHAIE